MENRDFRELQKYIWQKNIDRGFSKNTPEQKMLLLTEEIGELAKAIRKHIGMGFSKTTTKTETSEELADVLILLMGLASTLEIDLYNALRAKESKNDNRDWT